MDLGSRSSHLDIHLCILTLVLDLRDLGDHVVCLVHVIGIPFGLEALLVDLRSLIVWLASWSWNKDMRTLIKYLAFVVFVHVIWKPYFMHLCYLVLVVLCLVLGPFDTRRDSIHIIHIIQLLVHLTCAYWIQVCFWWKILISENKAWVHSKLFITFLYKYP